jgi:hypothetical protein
LCIAAGVLLLTALWRARATRNALNFGTLGLLNVALVEPVSGLVHLLWRGEGSRGYFDLMSSGSGATNRDLVVASAAAIIACGALLVGCKPLSSVPCGLSFELPRLRPPKTFLVFGFLLVAISLPATLLVDSLVHASGATRTVAVSGGKARDAELSFWLPWGASVLSLAAVTYLKWRRSLAVTAILVVNTAVVVYAIRWTGGRAVMLLVAGPVIICAWPSLSRFAKRALASTGVIAFMLIVANLAVRRTTYITPTYTKAGHFSVAEILDWQWGRFSMAGWASEYVRHHGYTFGSTFLSAVLSVPAALLKFVQPNAHLPSPKPVTAVTGGNLLGASDVAHQYVVPGLVGETYLNFGLLGVAILFWLIGRLLSTIDIWFAASRHPAQRLGIAYIGLVVVLQTVAAQSGAIFNYLLIVGLPMTVLAVAGHRMFSVAAAAGSATVESPGAHATPNYRSRRRLGVGDVSVARSARGVGV